MRTCLNSTGKKNQGDKLHLLTYALWQGNLQLFERLLQAYESQCTSDSQKKAFKDYIGKEFHFLMKAAECRNAACLRSVFELYKKYAIDYSTLSGTQRMDLLRKISEKGDIDCLKTLRAYLPALPLNDLCEALRVASEHDRQSIVQFWLNEIEEFNKATLTPDNTKAKNLSLKSIQKLSLPTFKQLLKFGFRVHESMIPQLLKRKDRRFFEAWLEYTPNTDRYRDLIEGPAPVLSQGLDLNIFQVLCRYGRNELIEKNWTAEAHSFGGDALVFACDTGNQALVTFLVDKGFRLDTEHAVKALKAAMANFEFDRVRAVLTVPLDTVEFFTEANKPLIHQLIAAHEIDFILRAWKKLGPAQKQDYLLHAVSIGSRPFFEKIAARYPLFSSLFIDVLLDVYKQNQQYTQVLDAAIHLADSLKTTHFAECFQKLIDPFNQRIHSRIKTDDPSAEKAFLTEARQSIGGLIALLIHAIEHHQFAFALKLMSFVHLTNDEQEQILVKAYARKETAILEFMLENYRSFRTHSKNYFNLEAQKEYGLLAKLLEGEQTLDPVVYMALLKRAVARHDEQIIALLSRHINTAYRAQGSPVYDAIIQGNVPGVLLLLKYGARIHEHPLPSALFTLAIQQPTADLLHALLQQNDFLTYFNQELGENLDRLFHHATPAVLLYAVNKVNMTEKYQEFLYHALTHDDVALFRRLKKEQQFHNMDLNKLFALACEHQACAVVNELLATPLAFDNRKALHGQLDKLFGVTSPQSDINAQAIYDRVYPKALYRLYELVKTERYRPFAALHTSIYTLIGDDGLLKASQIRTEHRKGLLRSRLISNALDRGDQVILNELLQQLEEKPPVNQEVMDIFAANLQKPLILGVLLDHFPLDKVIKEALIQKRGSILVTLLSGKPASILSAETLELLKQHSDLLLSALFEKAKRELTTDPRAQLNALLIPDSPLALAQALNHQGPAIKKMITVIQDLMIEGKHDLHMHFYDFQLEKKILDGFAAMEDIQPLIDQWVIKLPVYATRREVEDNLSRDALELLKQSEAQDAVRQIRSHFKNHDLTPHGFDEKKHLIALFEALETIEAKEQKKQSAVNQGHTVTQGEALPQPPETLVIEEEAVPVSQSANEKPCLNALFKQLDNYKQDRARYGQTRNAIPWFQYTKDDKTRAVTNLAAALVSPDKGINLHDEGVLFDGSLYTRLDAFITTHGTELARELQCPTAIGSLSDLIDFLNTRSPVASLINILEQYCTVRDTQPECYHWSIFSQFTGTEKKAAARRLIDRLKGGDTQLSERDVAALDQGSLGKELEKFIELYGPALEKRFNHAVYSLYDLIEAGSAKVTP